MINIPCGLCGKSVNSNHKAVQCDICNFWIHIKCNGLTANDYESLKLSDDPWFCNNCTNEALPFSIKVSPLVFNKSLSSAEVKTFLNKLSSVEIDNSAQHQMDGVNCKYYDVEEFSALDVNNSEFLLFHMNIASLSKHFDELKTLLGQLRHDISVIGITETGFQDNVPLINFDLPGYSYKHTSTKGEKGGALVFIRDNLDYIEHPDLDLLAYKDNCLESKFIEIIQAKGKTLLLVAFTGIPPCL